MSVAPRFHRLAVSDLRREAADAISMTFAIPKELEGDYSFTPGQYLTLRTTMDGEEVRRSYSICSGPDDGELRIAVKKVDGGAFSNWAADELKAMQDKIAAKRAERPVEQFVAVTAEVPGRVPVTKLYYRGDARHPPLEPTKDKH